MVDLLGERESMVISKDELSDRLLISAYRRSLSWWYRQW
jgi:hypothetical protein